jgi:hypothetical protein
MLDAPVPALAAPLASLCTTLRTQVVSALNGAGLGIGSGGPKLQFASSAQEPAAPPQLRSAVQDTTELLLMQCLPGPAPLVQLSELVPALADRVDPETPKNEVEPSGIAPPATMVALPPPK